MFGLAFINGQSWIFGPVSITGDTTITGNLLVTGWIRSQNSFHASNGSAANPSYAFYNSQTTGFYRVGADIIGLAVAGNAIGSIDSTRLSIGNSGTASDFYINLDAASGQNAYLRLNQNGVRAWNILNLATSGDLGFNDGSGTLMTLKKSSGNLLLGTTTDSSNGKLQLGTHTTSAGGIGFGTDTALFRQGGGVLALDGTTSNFRLLQAGTIIAQFNASGNQLYIDNIYGVGGSIIMRTGSGPTTALTLDSSQNATFAGRIGLTASGTNPIYSNFIPAATGTYAGLITMQAGGGSAAYGGALQLYGHSHASKPGWVSANISQGSGGKFAVNNSGLGGGTDVFTVDTNGNGSFNAALSIGNTVTAAASIASTHKVTMVIGGVTYYLLASNV